ncbi:MAG: carbohydrate binding domain-containing protein [Pseudomonadota bacterium]
MKFAIAMVAALVATAPFAAQAQDAAPINNPNPASFQVYGLPSPPKSVKDDGVQGGRALPVTVTGSGTPYAVGVNVPLTQAVKAGDRLTVMFYAKLQKAEPGVTTTKITGQVQLSGAPYTAIASKPVDLSPEWKLFTFDAVADKDYAKGQLTAAFHVNTGKQTVALGVVAVFDKAK